MKPPAPRFDPDELRLQAGDRSFERGLAYFRDGAVHLIRVDNKTVLATVSGGEDYGVRLTGGGRSGIGGSCTCPAFEDRGFCKHMVAAALAANAARAEGAPDPIEPIRAHLAAQPPEALVALVLDLALNDPALLRRLATAAAVAGPDPHEAAAVLRRELTAATRASRLPEYRGVRAWASEVGEILDAIETLAAAADPATALALAEHALARVGKAAEEVDDSDGGVGDLLLRAGALHLAACARLRPDPLALARDLFHRERTDTHDVFYGAAGTYADVLGPTGVAEYRRLAQAAWDAIPPRGPRDARREREPGAWHLFTILDRFADEAGDIDTRIALRAKDLATPWDYARLAGYCHEAGRAAEALARAEEGLFVFEDDPPDEGLVRLAVELLLAAGRTAEAEAHRWRAFLKRPSAEAYRDLCRLGGAAARDRAQAALEAGLPASAGLLVEILTDEGSFDRAWAAASAHPVREDIADRLARASEASHPREAVTLYTARVEQLAGYGGEGNYRAAVELVGRLARLRPAPEQAAWLAGVRERHARKRNFMKRLG
jgi:hypothetical protein